jgi:hypothetical protein
MIMAIFLPNIKLIVLSNYNIFITWSDLDEKYLQPEGNVALVASRKHNGIKLRQPTIRKFYHSS